MRINCSLIDYENWLYNDPVRSFYYEYVKIRKPDFTYKITLNQLKHEIYFLHIKNSFLIIWTPQITINISP